MRLSDLFMEREGNTAHILGNGPSLRQTMPYTPRLGDTVIGVNRAYRASGLDYWVCLDHEPWVEMQRSGPGHTNLNGATWVCPHNIVMPGASPVPRRLPSMVLLDKQVEPVVPPSDTRESAEGNKLWCRGSTVEAGVHLAMLLGCYRIVLHGVDLAETPRGRRFTDHVGCPAREEYTVFTRQLEDSRGRLQTFAGEWGEKYALVSASPVAVIPGWDCTAAGTDGVATTADLIGWSRHVL